MCQLRPVIQWKRTLSQESSLDIFSCPLINNNSAALGIFIMVENKDDNIWGVDTAAEGDAGSVSSSSSSSNSSTALSPPANNNNGNSSSEESSEFLSLIPTPLVAVVVDEEGTTTQQPSCFKLPLLAGNLNDRNSSNNHASAFVMNDGEVMKQEEILNGRDNGSLPPAAATSNSTTTPTVLSSNTAPDNTVNDNVDFTNDQEGGKDEEEGLLKNNHAATATCESSTTHARQNKFARQAKKIGVGIGGGAMVGVGMILLASPCPVGEILMVGGVGLLATEFEGPKRVVKNARDSLVKMCGDPAEDEQEKDKEKDEMQNLDASNSNNKDDDDQDAKVGKITDEHPRRAAVGNAATTSTSNISSLCTRTVEEQPESKNKRTVQHRMKGFVRSVVVPFLDQVVGDNSNNVDANGSNNKAISTNDKTRQEGDKEEDESGKDTKSTADQDGVESTTTTTTTTVAKPMATSRTTTTTAAASADPRQTTPTMQDRFKNFGRRVSLAAVAASRTVTYVNTKD
jgi:Putative transmembrane protein (PGPGW)